MKKLRLADNLKNELKAQKISQEALAKRLNTTQATVSRWTTGENFPDFETLFLICEILNVTPNELLGWDD